MNKLKKWKHYVNKVVILRKKSLSEKSHNFRHNEPGGELCEAALQYRFQKQDNSSSFGTTAPHYHQYQHFQRNL